MHRTIPLLVLLALLALSQGSVENPQWSHDGLRAVATWRPESAKAFRFRFGMTYTSGELERIQLVISRDERTGEPSGQRSETILFTRSDRGPHPVWSAQVRWQGQGKGGPVVFVAGTLTTELLTQPLPEGDLVMSGELTFRDSPRNRASDATVLKGAFFAFPTRERR